MNEIYVVGYGILIYDIDYNFFDGFLKEFNLAHNTEYEIFYDEYDEEKPIFICKKGLIKFRYEPFNMNELQNNISEEDTKNLNKIKWTFENNFDEDLDEILTISKPSWYIFNYLS